MVHFSGRPGSAHCSRCPALEEEALRRPAPSAPAFQYGLHIHQRWTLFLACGGDVPTVVRYRVWCMAFDVRYDSELACALLAHAYIRVVGEEMAEVAGGCGLGLLGERG